MQKVHQGQDILSFSSIFIKSKVVPNLKLKRGLIIALVGAFFITGFLVITTNYAISLFSGNRITLPGASEQAAFIPGTFISNDMVKGYIGK